VKQPAEKMPTGSSGGMKLSRPIETAPSKTAKCDHCASAEHHHAQKQV